MDRISSFFGDLKDGKHDGTKNDPRVCLLEVVPSDIRYWVSTSSTIGRTAGIAYGALTGKAKAPGEFRIITETEVCRCLVSWAHIILIGRLLVIDQSRPRSQREIKSGRSSRQ